MRVVTGTLEYWPGMPLAQPVFQLCGLFFGSEIFCDCKKSDYAMQGNQYKSGTLCGVLRVIFKGTAEKKKRDPGDFVRQDRRTGMLKEEENTHMNQGSM